MQEEILETFPGHQKGLRESLVIKCRNLISSNILDPSIVSKLSDLYSNNNINFGSPSSKRNSKILEFSDTASGQGIPFENVSLFLYFKESEWKEKNVGDMNIGQRPELLLISSDPRINFGEIFGSNPVINCKGIMDGGIFTIADNTKNDKDLEHTKDLAQLLYILEALYKISQRMHGYSMNEDLAQYIPICGVYEPDSTASFYEIADIQIKRMEKLIEEIKEYCGQSAIDGGEWNHFGCKLRLLPIVYNAQTRELFVVWRENKNTIKHEIFSEHIKNHNLSTNDVVKNHLDAIDQHMFDVKFTEIYKKTKNISGIVTLPPNELGT
ncbi:MAG: hypothetical protein AB1391_03990 [Candidatus Micrarchaeota archaeon]